MKVIRTVLVDDKTWYGGIFFISRAGDRQWEYVVCLRRLVDAVIADSLDV